MNTDGRGQDMDKEAESIQGDQNENLGSGKGRLVSHDNKDKARS